MAHFIIVLTVLLLIDRVLILTSNINQNIQNYFYVYAVIIIFDEPGDQVIQVFQMDSTF